MKYYKRRFSSKKKKKKYPGFSSEQLLNLGCETNDIAMVEEAIKLGAINANEGFYHACKGGHVDMVKRMIELRAKYFNNHRIHHFKPGLNIACINNHFHIIIYLFDIGLANLGDIMKCSCGSGNVNIVEQVIKLWGNLLTIGDINNGVCGVYSREYNNSNFQNTLSILKKLQKLGADLGTCIAYIAFQRNNKLFSDIINLGKNNMDLDNVLETVCDIGTAEMVESVINAGATNFVNGIRGVYFGEDGFNANRTDIVKKLVIKMTDSDYKKVIEMFNENELEDYLIDEFKNIYSVEKSMRNYEIRKLLSKSDFSYRTNEAIEDKIKKFLFGRKNRNSRK